MIIIGDFNGVYYTCIPSITFSNMFYNNNNNKVCRSVNKSVLTDK